MQKKYPLNLLRPIPFIGDYSISMCCFITWKHSCSLSLRCQDSFAATEVYFISSRLSHFIYHPASLSSDGALLQHPPPQLSLSPPALCPSALLSVFSFRLHLHWYHPAVFSSISPFFDPHSFQNCSSFHFLKTPQFCPFFSCSLSPGQSQHGTHRLVVLRSTHPTTKPKQ